MFDFLKMKREPPILPDGTVRRHFSVRGHVQGVGFRYRASYAARDWGSQVGYETNRTAASPWRHRDFRNRSISFCPPFPAVTT